MTRLARQASLNGVFESPSTPAGIAGNADIFKDITLCNTTSIQNMAEEISTIFSSTLGTRPLISIQTGLDNFAREVEDNPFFTGGNNYLETLKILASEESSIEKCKNILGLFTQDTRRCFLSCSGVGDTRPDSFKTFLGILLGVDISSADGDSKKIRKLIYNQLQILSQNTHIDRELRGTLFSICEDSFFSTCRPKTSRTATVMAPRLDTEMTAKTLDSLKAPLMTGPPGAACGVVG